MRIGIMGAGAVGTYVGALLSEMNHVVLIGRPAVVDCIKDRGVRISGRTEMHVRPDASVDPAALEDCDIVLLTVKAYDTEEAAGLVAEAAPMTTLVTLQNGLDNDEAVARAAPGLKSCAAITSFGVTLEGPGHIRHAGEGSTVLGRMASSPGEARLVADKLTEGGFPIEWVDNIRGHVWLKGVVNHCINPLTVIHRCKNGALLENPTYLQHMTGLAEEAISVIHAAVVNLPTDDVLGRVKEVARLTADNKSSMLQDVDRGKRTEIDHITGYIIRLGKRHGLDLPLSEFIYYEVKNLETEGTEAKYEEDRRHC
ncbi:MAG: 2-dehydropantoate 2-reductase [Thermoplasmata archaeon]|nr:MAG: 2-dehydropantoate 2-reductase [Thermoplasmata archaeon]